MRSILIGLLSVLFGGCGKRAEAPRSATISWIHPRLAQPTEPVAISDRTVVARLPGLFEGFDGPPPKVQPADPPMYDCVISITMPNGSRTDIKVYLPRQGIFPGMWRHPGGQLLYFDDDAGKQILAVVAPYVPKELEGKR